MGWVRTLHCGVLLATAVILAACQATGGAHTAALGRPIQVERLKLDVPDAWGGEVRCTAKAGCRLLAVEHENSMLVLHQLGPGRTSRLLDKQKLAYHPDGAAWLEDDLVVASVEASHSLDVYRVEGERLRLLEQIDVGIPPRDVVVVSSEQGRYRLLATPYSRNEVAWVDYIPGEPAARSVPKAPAGQVTRVKWCEAPWHPVRVERAPGSPTGGVAVACLDEQRVLFVPHDDLLGMPQVLLKVPGEERIVSRQARISPSGRWLYVALELGGRNLRIDMDSGAFQWIIAPTPGGVSTLPLTDDVVVWGFDTSLYLQRLGSGGEVLETRWLDVSGFPTGLQLKDVDGDGEDDLIVLNSASLPQKKAGVEVIYGPVWERAQVR